MPIPVEIMRILRNSKDRGYVTLAGAGIIDEYIPEIVEEIKKCPLVTSVDLQQNNISDAGAELLASLPIKCLNVRRNHIRDVGALKILNNPTLQWLDIGKNGITDVTGKALLQNLTLGYVNIEGNSHISKEMRVLIEQHISVNLDKIRESKKLLVQEEKDSDSASSPKDSSSTSSPRFKYASNKVSPATVIEEKEHSSANEVNTRKGKTSS